MSTIRKAARADLGAVCRIYDQIHTAEERGEATIGWQRGVYPERETAEAANKHSAHIVQEQKKEIKRTDNKKKTPKQDTIGLHGRIRLMSHAIH